MLSRLVSLALTALAAGVLISARSARAGHEPTNDVTLDLEHGLLLVYPLGLSVFNLYWGSPHATPQPAVPALPYSVTLLEGATYSFPDERDGQ